MKARHKRLVFVTIAIAGVAVAAALALSALQSNIAYFFSPTQVLNGEAPKDKVFRLGGMVADGSVQRKSGDLTMTFVVTDTAKKVTVSYTGILPDLFGEGQGVVTRGKLGGDGVFYAEEVLAKHDESYMPPEVQDAVDKAQKMGVAKKDAGQPQSSVNY
ncbi:MAG: cytochrome c maturation protein CcmE [Gammaproteobacteria bacterium]|jgi:cytochrome c-type biogenesis protein CcmE|nr:cytochrome c maturation protein CcmE [Gammaproteobacteria bacterium]